MMIYKLAYVAIKRFVVIQEVKGIFYRFEVCQPERLIKFRVIGDCVPFPSVSYRVRFLYFFVI